MASQRFGRNFLDRMEIIYTNHSIANRFPNHIEINKHLKKYPNLLNPILKHEQAHTDKFWSIHDFKLDFFSNNNIDSWEMFKFIVRYPSSLLQFSPILFSKKKGFIYDFNLIILYLTMLTVLTGTIYLGVRYL